MDAERNNKPRDRSTNTREQRAKETGVSTANYDVVMKSDDKELKQKVKSGNLK